MTRQARLVERDRDRVTGAEIAVAARLALGYPAPWPDDVETAEEEVALAAFRSTEYAVRRAVDGPTDPREAWSGLLDDIAARDDDPTEQVTLVDVAGGEST